MRLSGAQCLNLWLCKRQTLSNLLNETLCHDTVRRLSKGAQANATYAQNYVNKFLFYQPSNLYCAVTATEDNAREKEANYKEATLCWEFEFPPKSPW